ncbi:MAG: TrkA family potassium uptake protein [Lachnospiraceae bacterium]|nr:TrkA family potassium uptake protein [Lachnospiraceae bacterium]
MSNKSIAVLGLGKYGISLAKNLYNMGADVLVVDNDPDSLKEMAGCCTAAIQADLEIEEEILALDLKNMDIVVVAMAGNLSASILVVTVAKEKGVPLVVAKSSGERMSSILKKIGADKVIIPEESSGFQSARILLSDTLLDYFKVDDNLSMIEMRPEEKWVGHSLINLNLRKKHNMNVVAIKSAAGNWHMIDPSKPLPAECRLLIVIDAESLAKYNKI